MKILVVVAHPNLTESHANRMLMKEVEKHADIDVHVLSSAYVQGQLNVKKEQEMLEAYDRIVLQ
ncbi:general stress protein, partial [Bacillus thuringiensis]